MMLQKIFDFWRGIGTDPQRVLVGIAIICVVAYGIYLSYRKTKYSEMKIIWYSIAFNIFILICLIALFPFENKVAFATLELIWYLSFGWICGRLSSIK